MVDGFTQTPEDGSFRIDDTVVQVVVGVFETVISGIVGIQMEKGKDTVDIHKGTVGIVQRCVMETGKGKVELFEAFADIASSHFSCDTRGKVAAIEFADPAGDLTGFPCDIDIAHNLNSLLFFSV